MQKYYLFLIYKQNFNNLTLFMIISCTIFLINTSMRFHFTQEKITTVCKLLTAINNKTAVLLLSNTKGG